MILEIDPSPPGRDRRVASILLASLALTATASAQAHQLTREQCVRLDVPNRYADPRKIVDQPRVIDKARFRAPDLSDVRPGSVFVRFLPDVEEATKQAAHARVGSAVGGVRVEWTSAIVPDLHRIEVPIGGEGLAIDRYLDDPSVLYAEPEPVAYWTLNPNDPYFVNNQLWGMTGVGCSCSSGDAGSRAQWAWDEWTGTSNAIVAIVDTGIDYNHADLAPNMWTNPNEIPGNGVDDDGNGYVDDYRGWDFRSGDNDPLPQCSSHGTHVAGTVGAKGNNGFGVVGVNWTVSLMNLRCEVETGSCNTLTNTVAATDYAVSNGAHVSNHSYGSSNFSQAFSDVALAAQAFDHLLVCAAGNNSTDNDSLPYYPASTDLANVISVTATDSNGDQHYNYGATSVDLGAPGLAIESTVIGGGFSSFNGTSMATPHVAGAIALILSRHPSLTFTELRARLLTGITPNSNFVGKTVSGGILNVSRALGIWYEPGGQDPLAVGTKFRPFGIGQLILAHLITPMHGHLNFLPGTVPTSELPSKFDRPLFLDAPDGPVILGG